MQNAPEAAFSLINFIFDQVSIDLTTSPGKDLSISFEPKGVLKRESMSFELTFLVNVFSDSISDPFVKVRCKGELKFHNITDIRCLDSVPDFFYNNSVAILFPYVRAYVSVVTTQTNSRGIILPTLNLSSLGNELRENTSEE